MVGAYISSCSDSFYSSTFDVIFSHVMNNIDRS